MSNERDPNPFSREELTTLLDKYSESSYLSEFLIRDNKNLKKKRYPLGFPQLDQMLHGGIPSGLISIGANPSVGKTTLLLQAAHNFASSGTHVFFFSLEMAIQDLVAKAISEKTYVLSKDDNLSKSSDDLFNDEAVTDKEWEIIKNSILTLKEYSDNFTFLPGTFRNAEVIGKILTSYVQHYKQKAIAIIDYLQIMEPLNDRHTGSTKERLDDNIAYLKMISDSLDIPIILVSSFNRESYGKPVSFASFKESGLIEYSSDVIFALQTKSRKTISAIRDVELHILKQKTGVTNTFINLKYNAKFNHFEEYADFKEDTLSENSYLRVLNM